ncbi:MAG TPA: OFA family MFS transporter [Verrucomicrobiae bacterium]|nr:OFA family MFS transporter [Verrucomicrobiae bacterium]
METATIQTALPVASTSRRGWTVALSGLGINLALGVLYTWSIFKPEIKKDFGWSDAQLNDPYALCCVVFALAMIVAGRCQDKLGPRLTASIGGLLVGAGLVLISQSNSYAVWLMGFGVLAGIGIGFGYSSATPPALKWFPPAKTGLIAGLVVAGFGVAPVYLSRTTKYLLAHYHVQNSMLILGVAFLLVVCCLAQMLINPPAGFVPSGAGAASAAKPAVASASPTEILRQPQFWLLWLIYFIGAGAGLMVIGSINGMATKRLGADLAFLAVAATAVGNASGRIGAGFLSDKIGRRWTLMLVLAFQAVLMFVAIPVTGSAGAKAAVLLVATLMGLNYGANLSLFPSLTKDLWGLKNFGLNYGVLFTAWGAGSLLSLVSQRMLAASKSYDSSFEAAGGLLILGTLLTFGIKAKSGAEAQVR